MSVLKNSSRDLGDQKIKTLHQHLQTQFNGVIAKLSQEIDAITPIEVRTQLENLRIKLNKAFSIYCNSNTIDLKQVVEQFHHSCKNVLKEYKNCPKVQKVLKRSGVTQETIDNMLFRFSTGIQSAIYYTLDHTCLPQVQQQLSTAHQLLGALSTRFKQLNRQNNQLSKDDDAHISTQ